jgi:S1-C subfamily serine protease
MVRRTGQMGVPVTVLDGEAVIGFDRPRLEALIAARAAKSGAGTGTRAGAAQAPFGAAVKSVPGGLLVGNVRPGSAAEKTGLRAGDVITAINGRSIGDTSALVAALSPAARGPVLSVQRDGHELALAVDRS